MHSQRKAIVYAAVQHSTEEGHDSLRTGDLNAAAKHFSNALEKAELYRDDFLIRACSFNLGSCLVACGQPSKGLGYLDSATPPLGDGSDGIQNFADLEYNIGIARHAIGSVEDAIDAYVKAAKAYKELEDLPMQIETHNKLAACHQSLKQLKEAAVSFKTVADLYEDMSQPENRAMALSSLATLLAELDEMEECSKTLKSLLELCQTIDNAKLKGKIYHDIGMLYSSEKCYKSAYECFEQSYHSLQEITNEMKDKTLEAVVLLNMGASLNHISLFERAVIFHRLAADKFGELEDLKSQGQVFCNLAFAFSKIENYEDARASFTKAIQCCRNCNDIIGQCLATEGLAAIFFREKDYKNAIENYKEALSLVSKSGDADSMHGNRIVNKLAETVEYQLRLNRSSNDESMEANDDKTISGNPKLGRRRSRKGKPKYGKFNSLVAKGLEETSEEEEEESSSSSLNSDSESSTNSSSSEEITKKREDLRPSHSRVMESRESATNMQRRNYSAASPPLLDNGIVQSRDNGNANHLTVEEKPATVELEEKSNNQSKTCVIQ